jgi:hypothetical protein
MILLKSIESKSRRSRLSLEVNSGAAHKDYQPKGWERTGGCGGEEKNHRNKSASKS